MFRLPILLLLLTCAIKTLAQEASTVAISTTGCTVQVYCFPGRFDAYEMDDGSTVFADDCEKDGITWGIYCIKLKNQLSDLKVAEDSIISLLDFLKADFNIVSSKDYDTGHKLNKDDKTRGVFVNWVDAEKNKWKIKAWTNGEFICVMHVHSSKELPEKKVNTFLEGFRFPGMK